jgi:hypothetical protein
MASVIPDQLVPTVAVAGLLVALIGLLIALWAVLRLRRVSRRLAAATGSGGAGGAGGAPVDLERIDRLAHQLADATRRIDDDEREAQKAIQRVGVVRYNPFEDTGSNQSFVLAMLDARGDGFVLSSLHSRHATRMFLKQVSGGKADSAISAEEAEALRVASGR